MNQARKEAEVKYRLAVILLSGIKEKGLISYEEYAFLRIRLAHELNAPIGLLEVEDRLWEVE